MATARSASACEVAGEIVGGDHRLALAHQHAQAEIVAFGAFGLLHRAVAQLDRQRQRAHRHRVGCVGAGLARGLHQPLGALDERGLVEQGRGGGVHGWAAFKWACECVRKTQPRLSEQFAPARQRLVNHGSQRPVNHGARSRAVRRINPKH